MKLPIADEKREVIAQYDNALYYNDYIVSGIIDKFRDEETLVIYVPDHGEAVYDEGGFAGHIEENPSRHMIEVPVIMQDVYTVPLNLAGLPGISVPCGFSSAGLPIGLQIIGKALAEDTLIRAAYTYEQSQQFHNKIAGLGGENA